MTGSSLRTLTNSAGGALALTGGGSGGRAGGGGGGGGDASVTYSDRSVSSWGGRGTTGADKSEQRTAVELDREEGRVTATWRHTHTHRMKVSLAHMTGEEAPMWSACADSTSDQINSNM